MPHKKYLFALLGILLFTLAAALGYYAPSWRDVHQREEEWSSFAQPEIPPEVLAAFSREFARVRMADEPMQLPDNSVVGPDGRAVHMADFKGKVVLVNFWATWCAPCVVELPSLKQFADHYDGQLEVIGVALEPGKTHKEILNFLEKRGLGDFAGYLDQDGGFSAKLGLAGIPTSFLIGKDGLILYRFEGDADWTSAATKGFFDVFLSTQSRIPQ